MADWFNQVDTGEFQAGPGQRLNVQAGSFNQPRIIDRMPTPAMNMSPTKGSGQVSNGAPVSSSPGGAVGRVPGASGAPPQGGQQGGYQPYSDEQFLRIIHRFPPTYEGAKQAAAALDQAFGPGVVQLMDHPTKLDKFILPGGRVADQMYGAGGPDARWNDSITLEGPGHGGAGGAIGAAGAGAGMDPSYGFRFDEGMKALQRSAAAKGTLLTGGVAKALVNYGQNAASQEFGNIFDRNYKLAGLGLNASQTAAASGTAYSGQAGNTNQNYANNQGNLITGRGNATAAGQVNQGNIWGNTIGQIATGVAGSFVPGRGGRGADGYNYDVPYPNSPLAR